MGRKKNRKKKGPKIQTDNKGQFYYRTYFVRGKQRREKVRDFVLLDGKPVDTYEFLRNNASDIDLHQMGEYELLHERECERNAEEQSLRFNKPEANQNNNDYDDDNDIPF